MAASDVQLAPVPQTAAFGYQLCVQSAGQPQSSFQDGIQSGGSATIQPSGERRKRKCGSPRAIVQPAASLLELDSSGSRHSADSDSFRLDLDTLVHEASPESQQQPSFRPHTPSSAASGKRRRLSLGSATSGSTAACGPTPPPAPGFGGEASPASAHLLRLPSVPPPVPAVAPLAEPACGSAQLFDIGGVDEVDCDDAAADPSAAQPTAVDKAAATAAAAPVPLQQPAGPQLEQSQLQQQVAAQQSHHQQLLHQQQTLLAQQQQQRTAAAAEAALQSGASRLFAVQHQAAAATALSRCVTMPPVYRQPQLQQQVQMQPQPQPQPQPQQPQQQPHMQPLAMPQQSRQANPFATAAGSAAFGGIALGVPLAAQQRAAQPPPAAPPQLQGGWAYSLPTLTRLRRSTSASDAQPVAQPLYPVQPLQQPLQQAQHSMQPFSELLAAAERRRVVTAGAAAAAPQTLQQQQQQQLQQQQFQQQQLIRQQHFQNQILQQQGQLRHSLSANAATGTSRLARQLGPAALPPLQPGHLFSAASVPAQPAFTFAAAAARTSSLHTRSAHATLNQNLAACGTAWQPSASALLPVSLRPRCAAQPTAAQPVALQHQPVPLPPVLRAMPAAAPQPLQPVQQQVVQQQPAARKWPPPGAPGGTGGAPQLLARWGRALPLRRGETLLLALHMWERLQPKVQPAKLLAAGAPQPWQAALLGCLWVAAKLEERRRGLPSASKVGELLGLDRQVVAAVEIHVMEALDWAPTAGWQSRRRDFRA